MDFFDSAFDSIHDRTVDLKEDSSFFESCFNDMCSDDYVEESISSVFSSAKKAFLKIFNNVWKKIGSSASKLKKHLTGAPLFKTESCDDLFESAGNDIVDAKLEDKPMIGFRILKIDFNAYFAWWTETFSVIKDSLKRASAHPDDVETQAKDYIKIMDTWVLTDKEMRNEYTKIVQKFKLRGSGESHKIVADAYKECFSEDAFNALSNNPKKSKKFIDTVIDTMNNDVIKRYNEYNSEFDSSSEIRKMYLDLWNDGNPKCNIMLLKGVDAQLSEISSSMDGMRKNSFAFIKDFTNRLISASKSNDHVSSESVESVSSTGAYTTEVAAEAFFIGAWTATAIAITGLIACGIRASIKEYRKVKDAIKKYEQEHPSIIPFNKLKYKRYKITGFDHKTEEIKNPNSIKNQIRFGTDDLVDAYYNPTNNEEVIAFLYRCQLGVNAAVSSVKVIRGAESLNKDALYYYTVAYLYKMNMWGQSSEVEGWVKDMLKSEEKPKKEKAKTESFEENDLSLAEEFFPEAAVDTILAPLSKFRAKIATWNKDKYVEKAKRTTGTDNKEVVPYWDPKNIEASFSEYMKDVNSKIIPKLKDHADRNEIVEICNAANADYTRRIKETKAKDRGRYTRDVLRKECKRCSDYVVSSATKISNAIEAASKGSSDPNFARACAYAVTKTSAICSDALSAIGVNDDLYDADVMARRAQATGMAAGVSAGYVAGSH